MPKSSFNVSFLKLKIFPSLPIEINILRDHRKFCKCVPQGACMVVCQKAFSSYLFIFFPSTHLNEILKIININHMSTNMEWKSFIPSGWKTLTSLASQISHSAPLLFAWREVSKLWKRVNRGHQTENMYMKLEANGRRGNKCISFGVLSLRGSVYQQNAKENVF